MLKNQTSGGNTPAPNAAPWRRPGWRCQVRPLHTFGDDVLMGYEVELLEPGDGDDCDGDVIAHVAAEPYRTGADAVELAQTIEKDPDSLDRLPLKGLPGILDRRAVVAEVYPPEGGYGDAPPVAPPVPRFAAPIDWKAQDPRRQPDNDCLYRRRRAWFHAKRAFGWSPENPDDGGEPGRAMVMLEKYGPGDVRLMLAVAVHLFVTIPWAAQWLAIKSYCNANDERRKAGDAATSGGEGTGEP